MGFLPSISPAKQSPAEKLSSTKIREEERGQGSASVRPGEVHLDSPCHVATAHLWRTGQEIICSLYDASEHAIFVVELKDAVTKHLFQPLVLDGLPLSRLYTEEQVMERAGLISRQRSWEQVPEEMRHEIIKSAAYTLLGDFVSRRLVMDGNRPFLRCLQADEWSNIELDYKNFQLRWGPPRESDRAREPTIDVAARARTCTNSFDGAGVPWVNEEDQEYWEQAESECFTRGRERSTSLDAAELPYTDSGSVGLGRRPAIPILLSCKRLSEEIRMRDSALRGDMERARGKTRLTSAMPEWSDGSSAIEEKPDVALTVQQKPDVSGGSMSRSKLGHAEDHTECAATPTRSLSPRRLEPLQHGPSLDRPVGNRCSQGIIDE